MEQRLPGGENHHHLTAFKLGILLNFGEAVGFLLNSAQQFHAEMLVGHFASSKTQRHLHLVAFIEEARIDRIFTS